MHLAEVYFYPKTDNLLIQFIVLNWISQKEHYIRSHLCMEMILGPLSE